MENRTLEDLKRHFRKQNPIDAGKDGEKFAAEWLRQEGWNYIEVEQGKESLSEQLRKYGGKRPDFIATLDAGSWTLLLDAKYHSTDAGKVFRITKNELEQYRKLEQFAREVIGVSSATVLLMVFPKEFDGLKFAWVGLSCFKNAGEYTEWQDPALEISLVDEDRIWCVLNKSAKV